ncbi:MAG: hypothetical protein AB8B49_09580 [Nitratireductor sp.]
MNLRSAFIVFALLITGVLANYNEAEACSCIAPPRHEIIAQTDTVFIGRVQEVRVIGNKRHAWVKKLRQIKNETQLPQIIELVTELDGGLCGYAFQVGNDRITFGADKLDNGVLYVNSCTMYGLSKTNNNIELEKPQTAPTPRPIQKPKQTSVANPLAEFTSASCLDQNKTGFAQCAAICPAGQVVLNCSHSIGSLSTGDTCQSIAQFFSGGTDANSQPNPQPHDRCTVSAVCADGRKSLSVQSWATCFKR